MILSSLSSDNKVMFASTFKAFEFLIVSESSGILITIFNKMPKRVLYSLSMFIFDCIGIVIRSGAVQQFRLHNEEMDDRSQALGERP
jgi:hypothetical protein